MDPVLTALLGGAAVAAIITNVVTLWLERGRARREHQLRLLDVKRDRYALFLGSVARIVNEASAFVWKAKDLREGKIQPHEMPPSLIKPTYELIYVAEEIALLHEGLGRIARDLQDELSETESLWEWRVEHEVLTEDDWFTVDDDLERAVASLRRQFFEMATDDLGTRIGRFRRWRRRCATGMRRLGKRMRRALRRIRRRMRKP